MRERHDTRPPQASTTMLTGTTSEYHSIDVGHLVLRSRPTAHPYVRPDRAASLLDVLSSPRVRGKAQNVVVQLLGGGVAGYTYVHVLQVLEASCVVRPWCLEGRLRAKRGSRRRCQLLTCSGGVVATPPQQKTIVRQSVCSGSKHAKNNVGVHQHQRCH